jgi:nucleolar protein 15
MAPENVKGKKRKGATDASPKPKKHKKSDETAAKVDAPAKTKAPRKKSEDMWDEDIAAVTETMAEKKSKKKAKVADESAAPAEETSKKQSKKARKDDTKEEDAPAEAEVSAAAENKKSKKSKTAKAKAKAQPKEPSPEPVDEAEDSGSDDGEENDQTAALLAGFDSDRDESDAEKEDEGLDGDNFQDKVPKGIMKQLKNASENTPKTGVIYVGRIPHGFYETQMKAYFSQFGKVLRLRVSRNKKTGAPKHYAFVEFQSAEVAEIVAKTMDKYLMFGHILQCSVIPSEQVHEDLFVGANQRFKRVPRNKMAGNEMARGAERAVWEKRIENEKKRRNKKNLDLKEKMDYEYTGPALKAVETVAKKTTALETGSARHAIEAPAAESNSEQPAITEPAKKSKKARKSNADADVDTAEAVEKPQAVEEKPKKVKKAEAEPVAESKAEDAVKEKKRKVSSAGEGGVKTKKTKKSKA